MDVIGFILVFIIVSDGLNPCSPVPNVNDVVDEDKLAVIGVIQLVESWRLERGAVGQAQIEIFNDWIAPGDVAGGMTTKLAVVVAAQG